MLPVFGHQNLSRRNPASLAAAVLMLVLPLAAPTVAESVLEANSEREATTTDSVELLAWATDSRPASRRPRTDFQQATSLPSLAHQKPGHPTCYPLSGHRLSCGIMAPLRC